MYYTSRYDILNSIHSFSSSNKTSNYVELKLIFILFYFVKWLKFRKISLHIKNIFYMLYAYIVFILMGNLILSMLFNKNFDSNFRLDFFMILSVLFLFFKNKSNFIYITYTFFLINMCSIYEFFIVLMCISFFYSRQLFLHFCIFLIIFLLYSNSSVEIFFKKVDYFNCFGKMFSINKSWYVISSVENNFVISSINKFEQKNILNSFYEIFFRFFSQNIFTGVYFNKNIINTNTVLNFFQKNLFLYSVSVFFFFQQVFFNTKKNCKKVV